MIILSDWLVDCVIIWLVDWRSNSVAELREYIVWLQAHHQHCLNDFIEAQAVYYAQCHQYMTDLQKQLGRFADLCVVLSLWVTFVLLFP